MDDDDDDVLWHKRIVYARVVMDYHLGAVKLAGASYGNRFSRSSI